MSTINTKDTQVDPNYDPMNDPDMEPVYESEGDYEYDMEGAQAPAGPALPQTPTEMRAWLGEQMAAGKISQAEYNQYIGRVNQAAGFSPEKQAEVFAAITGEVAPGAAGGYAVGEDEDNYAGVDVTSKQITDLMNQIKSGQVKPIDEEFTSEKCVQLLSQALTDERNHNDTRAAEEFMQVLDAVGGNEAIDPKNLAAQKLGDMPASIDKNGTIHFDGRGDNASADLNLRAPGDRSKVVVDNATSVTLTPKNDGDEITLSEEGDYYVVQMGDDTFKINKNAKLIILSDHVSGSVANDDGNITIGASAATSKKYVDPAKLEELSGKISSGAQEVEQNKPLGNDSDNAQAAQVLNAMAAAMAETDPKKRQEAWQAVSDSLKRIFSQGTDLGHVNDIAQAIFNVLYDKLGEDGLKDALKQGIIPSDVAGTLSGLLTIKPGENTSNDSVDHAGGGGPGWTHQTSADFLNEYGSVPAAPSPTA